MQDLVSDQKYPINIKWVYKSLLGTITALSIISFFMLMTSASSKDYDRSGMYFYIIVYSVFGIFSLIIGILRRATFHYVLESQFLNLKQGILSKQERHIPYGVIQNTLVKQDLFDRLFGLASVSIENASFGAGKGQDEQKIFGLKVGNTRRRDYETIGFSGNKVSIPGLLKEDAEALKTIVLQKMKENPIEDNQSGL
jgi:uncharacterized membrane protein YdbT with pleckstrin-like domain